MIILLAVDSNGAIVHSLERSKTELIRLRRTRSFTCPQCGEPVQLKAGDVVIPHFAHLRASDCETSFSEGETKEHLLGKDQLLKCIRQSGRDAELEPYLPDLRQRPDLLAMHEGRRQPIEFQCSTIPLSEVEERTEGYRNAGMEPLWILLTPAKLQALPLGLNMIRLSKFQEHFLTPTHLLTYHPLSESFHYFSGLLHVAGQRYIGMHLKLPARLQPFPFAIPRPLTFEMIQQYASLYSAKRKEFLATRIFNNRRGVKNPFLRCCYTLRIRPENLPGWIGLPVENAESFREHDAEWQLRLLVAIRNADFPFGAAPLRFLHRFVSGFAGETESQTSACTAYLKMLEEWGITSFESAEKLGENKILRILSDRFLAKQART